MLDMLNGKNGATTTNTVYPVSTNIILVKVETLTFEPIPKRYSSNVIPPLSGQTDWQFAAVLYMDILDFPTHETYCDSQAHCQTSCNLNPVSLIQHIKTVW